MRKCTCCGRWLVASTVNFHRNKYGRYGLASECKECRNKKGKQWRLENKDKRLEYYEANKKKLAEYQKQYRKDNKSKIAERDKQYYEANREKISEYHKQYYEANKDKILERTKQWYEDNKEKKLEYNKQYCEDNKDKILEYHRQYREDNKEKIAERHKRYCEANKEKLAEYKKQYRQSPQGQVVAFNGQQRRRTKEEKQGSGITKDQWLEMMNYFDWKCAYSDEYIGGKQNYQRTIDHIVPLNSGGDNMVWNLVPMTRSLNSSKQDKDMLEWYKEQDFYSEDRLEKIYKWQEYAYNKYGKNTEYFNSGNIQIKLI